MSWGWSWKPYVSAAQRRAKAAREASKLAKKGRQLSPVQIAGRNMASTFWGKAWCENLEAYSDFSNRLPRGRTYARNGAVVDLQITAGQVTALVSGSSLYKIQIAIKPLPQALWQSVQTACAGKIDSLLELLQGRLSPSVLEIVTHRENGLFPKPAEITMDCSCPDWADMCKHVAASLYGIGARLDQNPELLFLLRGIDPAELISKASQAITQTSPNEAAAHLAEAELADVFGIDIESPTQVEPKIAKPPIQKVKSPTKKRSPVRPGKKPARKTERLSRGKEKP